MKRPTLLLVAALVTGCAAAPKAPPEPTTYTIPVVKPDNTIVPFVVEREPGETERMLFCVETIKAAVCIAEKDGRALTYLFPLAPPAPEPPGI